MNKALNRQQGLSFPILVIVLAFAALVGMFALKVGPSYFEYMTVAKIAEDTAANTEVMRQPRSKVLSHIDQAYRTNSLWDLRASDTIVLKKDGKKGYKVDVDYEKRTRLFANIHVVTVFRKSTENP